MAMQDLNDLWYFVQVVDNGGFSPASRVIGIPKSRLSRRIALLEESLETRLIQRSTRSFTVTEAGQIFYRHCKAMIIEAEAAQEAINSLRAEPRGLIRLSCPIALLHVHIGEMLAKFMALYPQVTVQLEETNRQVDVLNENVDLAVRVRPLPLDDSDLVMRKLADRGMCLVASPELVERFTTPASPADLQHWPSLALSKPQQIYRWCLFGPDNQEVTLHHKPRFVTTDMDALRAAALAGVGLVQLPILMVNKQLADGSLVRLLPEWRARREVIHLVFPSRRGQLPAVRALIDFLVESYAEFEEE
ncbi:LysR family transcriptional regulator [Buttiauxella sp. A2-C1_F]|jgi:DNA-binding transcriptional LysR family regulator|uniref:LysR family transcriptional regulator n=1 Tax=Buttiauxella TaxID=82976 RepID=UPI001D01C63C|nr:MULTISPECIES: LysR family transcriptional regulator [Buttiauxella]MCE0800239.1 LysR family transcriptional regulator [Buttiauxella sp. W03-F01]MCE0844971.1 LysR family transcriptional regulator [Buttiauxella sp. A2-C1_F]